MTNQPLKIIYWNIHGINSRSIGVKSKNPEFLKIVSHYDIVCLSELHSDKAVSLPGFVTKKQKFRKKLHKGPKIGGGIAVYIKNNLVKNFHLLANNSNDSIWLTTKPSTGKPTRLGFFYCSPENPNSNFHDIVNGEIESFTQDYDAHIFGDFNARTKDERENVVYDKYDDELGIPSTIHKLPPRRNTEDMKIINKRGKDLLDICKTNDLVIANGRSLGDLFGSYTCHQKRGSSVVDYLMSTFNSSGDVANFTVGTYMPTLSDHSPLQANINIKSPLNKQEFTKVPLHDVPPRYIWKNEDDVLFKDKLASEEFKEKVDNIMSAEDGPDLVQDVRNLLIEAADACDIKKTRKAKHNTNAPWFDKECCKLKKNIGVCGKKLRENPNDVAVREKLYFEKKKLHHLVRKNKFLHKKSLVDKMCENLSNGIKKEYWNMLRKLEGPPDTTTYMHEHQLIEHFKSILNDPGISTTDNFSNDTSQSTTELNRIIVKKELDRASKILKNGKSPGLDTILNEMLQPLVELYPNLLLKLFNSILTNTWIGKDWLLSLITALHKKGPKEDPENYRGISLMSCMAKLFLTILNNRLTDFALENAILSPGQLGFVSGNRTSDPHIILSNLVKKYCHNRKKNLFGCFVDFSKAFDSVPRDILLEKLKNRGINGNIFEIIKTIYSNDMASVKFGTKSSPPFRTNRGVRQGCVLSPLLFNIFLSDIQSVFDEGGCNPKMNDVEISCLIWADDILILSETEKGLQDKLNNLASYCKTNKLQVNTDKTKTMIFTKSGRLMKNQFFFGKTKLENVRKYKYLGFIVTPSGEIKTGLEDLRVRALRAITKIRQSLGAFFQANIWNTLHLYNYMVKPILLYCSDFWGTLKHPKNSPIERTHLSFHKQLLGVRQQTNTYGVHLEIGSHPILFNAIKASVKNWERIRQYNCRATYEEATIDNLPWATSIKQTFEVNGMLETFLAAGMETSESDSPHMLLFQRLKDQYNQEALGSINEESSKLKFYSLLKTELGAEKYLSEITHVKQRVDLTRLRLSSHSLHIETGRHNGTQREDRTCTLCNSNLIEDETHVIITCPMYNDIRREYLNDHNITDEIPDMEKAVLLLRCRDLKPIAGLIHKIFKHRGIMLDSLATLNDMMDKVEVTLANDSKIEDIVRKSLSDMVSNIVLKEHSYTITKFDEISLKMTITKPKLL